MLGGGTCSTVTLGGGDCIKVIRFHIYITDLVTAVNIFLSTLYIRANAHNRAITRYTCVHHVSHTEHMESCRSDEMVK